MVERNYTLTRVRREMFEIKPIPTNKVAQKPGSYGAPVLKRAMGEEKQTSKAASPHIKPPARVVTTRQAPPGIKKPPRPPPPREDRHPIPVRSRTRATGGAWFRSSRSFSGPCYACIVKGIEYEC